MVQLYYFFFLPFSSSTVFTHLSLSPSFFLSFSLAKLMTSLILQHTMLYSDVMDFGERNKFHSQMMLSSIAVLRVGSRSLSLSLLLMSNFFNLMMPLFRRRRQLLLPTFCLNLKHHQHNKNLCDSMTSLNPKNSLASSSQCSTMQQVFYTSNGMDCELI